MSMKIRFGEKDSKKIIAKIKDTMGDRPLGQMVDFSQDGTDIVVTISKMGTSKLIFAHKSAGEGSELTLSSEKIALTHKAFKDEVKEKIIAVIQKAGGTVV